MNYKFLPEADSDLNSAVAYYENCQTFLGIEFAVSVSKTIDRIMEYPTAWTVLSNNCRRSLVGKFPYGVIYSIEPDCILIIIIMNLHRHPDYWKDRI